MVDIKPFRSVRPAASLAEQVAALPYDTMNSAEARELVTPSCMLTSQK